MIEVKVSALPGADIRSVTISRETQHRVVVESPWPIEIIREQVTKETIIATLASEENDEDHR